MITKIQSFLSIFDFFAVEPRLLFKRDSFKSACGGLVSLIILTFSLVLFVPSTIAFFQQQKISIQRSKNYDFETNEMPSNNEDFNFAIAKNDLTKRIYKIQVVSIEKDGQSQKKNKIAAQKCNVTQWQKDYGPMFQYIQVSNTDIYCFPKKFNTSLYLKKQKSRSLQMTVQFCTQNTCMSKAQIIDYTQKGNDLPSLVISYPKLMFSPSKLEYKNYTCINEVVSVFNPEIKDTYRYSFTVFENVVNDQNLNMLPNIDFFHNKDSIKSIFTINLDTYLENVDDRPLTIQFSKDQQIEEVERKFDKLDQFLSQIGGIMSFFVVVGTFIIEPYNRMLLNISLQEKTKFSDMQDGGILLKESNYINFIVQQFESCRQQTKLREQMNLRARLAYLNRKSEELLSAEVLFQRIKYFVESNFHILIRLKEFNTWEQRKKCQERDELIQRLQEGVELNSSEQAQINKLLQSNRLKQVFGELKINRQEWLRIEPGFLFSQDIELNQNK